MDIRIGTAGWTIPAQIKNHFAAEGSHLERYGRQFNCVEINSSFYRDHKPETYGKWAASTPKDFRFSVKLSRHFTHDCRLRETGERLRLLLEGIGMLGEKWGVLLIQLPPGLGFEIKTVEHFLMDLRRLYTGMIAWEPRHLSWSGREAAQLMAAFGVDRVEADPERCPGETWAGRLSYLRLHGSPEIYRSSYEPATLREIAERLTDANREAWCIFDNTTFGFATENAVELGALIPPR